MLAPVFVCEGRFEARFAADSPRYKGLWAKNVKYEYCHKSCSIIYLQNMQCYATYVVARRDVV